MNQTVRFELFQFSLEDLLSYLINVAGKVFLGHAVNLRRFMRPS